MKQKTIFILTLATLLQACDDKPAPTSAPPPSRSTTPGGEDLALAEAKRCFASRFLQRGDFWATFQSGFCFIEYNTPTFKLTPIQLASDKLNGYEHRTRVRVSPTAQRLAYTMYPVTSWDPSLRWDEWTATGGVQFDLVKQRGVWKCMSSPYDSDHQHDLSFEKLSKPERDKLPH